MMSVERPGAQGGGESGRSPSVQPRGAFVPLLILAFTFVAWAGFQTVMLVSESRALAAARESQEKPVQDATKLQQALDALARDTVKLADGGNVNARFIVEELRKRGVTINPNAEARK